jgi:CRP-like cAMP-binding protein
MLFVPSPNEPPNAMVKVPFAAPDDVTHWACPGAKVQVREAGESLRDGRQDEGEDEGRDKGKVVVLLTGWAFTYQVLQDGQRQIVKIDLPGDIIGLSRGAELPVDWGCEALTTVTFVTMSRQTLLARAVLQPRFALRILAESMRSETLIRERLSDIARRSARERILNFLHELWCRCQSFHRRGNPFRIPLTQCQLADALGLTSIHVSRTLKEFRQMKWLAYENRHLVIIDPSRLASLSTLGECYERWLRQPAINALMPPAELAITIKSEAHA